MGYSFFSGNGTTDTAAFDAPPNLPWLIEWESEGTGANAIVVTLMDPVSNTEVNVIVSDTGTGQIGGVNLVVGNLGTFYLKIEGPGADWKIWITQQ